MKLFMCVELPRIVERARDPAERDGATLELPENLHGAPIDERDRRVGFRLKRPVMN